MVPRNTVPDTWHGTALPLLLQNIGKAAGDDPFFVT